MRADPLDDFERRLQICQEMIKKCNQKSLESILVRLLLVEAYGAYEKTIRDAINRRAEDSSDDKFAQYLGRATRVFDKRKNKFTRPFAIIRTYSFIRELKTYNTTLNMSIPSDVNSAYNKLGQARNRVAHGGEIRITLEELLQMHKKAKHVPLTLVRILHPRSN